MLLLHALVFLLDYLNEVSQHLWRDAMRLPFLNALAIVK